VAAGETLTAAPVRLLLGAGKPSGAPVPFRDGLLFLRHRFPLPARFQPVVATSAPLGHHAV